MLKKLSALTTGATLIAMATIIPAFAQTETATTDVAVDSFLEFSIANPSADCTATAGGDCPFGDNGETSETTLDNTSAYASSSSAANTTLRIRTNNTSGAQVSAYGTNGVVDGSNCLVAGTDVITDTVADLQAAQAANEDTDLAGTDDETGLAFRLLDTGTSAALREADEDTQWGTGDVVGTDALWASFPMTLANDEVIFDTTSEQVVNVDGIVTYFAGVAQTQAAGNYTCVANYVAATI